MASVSIKEMSLNFGTLSVLNSLNLDVQEGEFLVLLGPSGCGKSTLLNCIAGLLDVSDGQIFISGKNVTWEEPNNRGIGMVFQSYALYPQMSVRKNLSFGLKIAGHSKSDIDSRIERASEILQIGPLLDRKPAQLSGGQRQRVAIGRALVRDVDVFLFDEPLSNLDAKLRSELRVEIKRLHQKLENTMIYVTHDQIEALTLADRIAIMKGGIIQQLDKPLSIFQRPKNLFVAGFIGSPSMNFIAGSIVNQENGPIFSNSDFQIPLKNYQTEQELSDGLKTILGVRPEHIQLGKSDPEYIEAMSATVELTEPMGSDSLIWLRSGDTTFSVRVDSQNQFKVEEKLPVYFNISTSSLFDANTEERI